MLVSHTPTEIEFMKVDPRETSGSRSKGGAIMICLVAFAVPLLIVTHNSVPTMLRCQRLAERGVNASATIIGHSEHMGKAGTSHFVSYKYAVDGRSYLGEDQLIGQSSRTEGTLEIIYDSAEPGISIVTNGNQDYIEFRYEKAFGTLKLFGGLIVAGMILSTLGILSRPGSPPRGS